MHSEDIGPCDTASRTTVVCNTAPSPFSLCSFEIASLLLSNLRGLPLEVGSMLKDDGIDGGGRSEKSIEWLSVISYQRQASSLTGLLVR